ncbi:hypothetical protein ACFXAE_21855 [Streptomyces sp. NPDC059454]|uniref:hypothetical protein n=1 Tax=Streptomyces sp. NPDC059454 TaxID=3346836 RepID=UPI0036A91756
MRSRWAAAVVLLASVLLLTLCSPAPAADRPAPVHPVAQQDQPAEARHDEPAEAVPEGGGTPGAIGAPEVAGMPEAVGVPFPGEGDASPHRPVTRPPRASGAAGAVGTAHPTAGTASTVTARRRSAPRPYPAGPPQGRGTADPAPSTTGLRTFRC